MQFFMIINMGIQIGSLFLPYYGLLIVTGIAVASIVGIIQTKIFKLDVNDFIIVAALGGLGGFLGAKLLYIIVSFSKIDWSRITDPDYLEAILKGGFVFYGGLIGGLLLLLLSKKLFKIDAARYLAVCMPCLPIVHAFGRIGCSLAGCCYGMPYDGPFAITYHNSIVAPKDIPLFPVQLTEAVCNLIIAAVLLIYIHKNKDKSFYSLPLYLFMYAPVRFILELLRYDSAERGSFLFLSTSQWISIGLVAVAALLTLFIKHKAYNNTAQ